MVVYKYNKTLGGANRRRSTTPRDRSRTMSEHAAKRQRTSSQDAAPSYADWQVRKKRSFLPSNAHTAGGARRVDRQDLLLQQSHQDHKLGPADNCRSCEQWWRRGWWWRRRNTPNVN